MYVARGFGYKVCRWLGLTPSHCLFTCFTSEAIRAAISHKFLCIDRISLALCSTVAICREYLQRKKKEILLLSYCFLYSYHLLSFFVFDTTRKDFFPKRRWDENESLWFCIVSDFKTAWSPSFMRWRNLALGGRLYTLMHPITENSSSPGTFLSTEEASMQDPAEKIIVMQFVVQSLIHLHFLSSTQLNTQKPSGNGHGTHHLLPHHPWILIVIPLGIKASSLPVGIQSYN